MIYNHGKSMDPTGFVSVRNVTSEWAFDSGGEKTAENVISGGKAYGQNRTEV